MLFFFFVSYILNKDIVFIYVYLNCVVLSFFGNYKDNFYVVMSLNVIGFFKLRWGGGENNILMLNLVVNVKIK